MTANKLVRQVAERLHPGVGCTDHGCVFGHPGGMGTNGGCECMKERNPILLKRTIMQMADVARCLAAFAYVGEEDDR
jgi:hypothetical protein